MRHNIRLADGTIQSLDFDLGSGVPDRNGREIYEGDVVLYKNVRRPVDFQCGAFYLDDWPLCELWSDELAIVDNVSDD